MMHYYLEATLAYCNGLWSWQELTLHSWFCLWQGFRMHHMKDIWLQCSVSLDMSRGIWRPKLYLTCYIVIGWQSTGRTMWIGKSLSGCTGTNFPKGSRATGKWSSDQHLLWCCTCNVSCYTTINDRHYCWPKQWGSEVVSKQQNTVESCTFESKFVSLMVAMVLNCAMHYKIAHDGSSDCRADKHVWGQQECCLQCHGSSVDFEQKA